VQSRRGAFATQGVTWAGIPLTGVIGSIPIRLGITRGGSPSSRTALIWEIPAYNLGNFLREMALPREVKHWSLTRVRETLIKIGAKVVSRSQSLTFQMAEVAVPRRLFAAILERIDQLRLVPGTG
jgi:hypothetical protein